MIASKIIPRGEFVSIYESRPVRIEPSTAAQPRTVWWKCIWEHEARFDETKPEAKPVRFETKLDLGKVPDRAFYLFELGGIPHVARKTKDGFLEVYEVVGE